MANDAPISPSEIEKAMRVAGSRCLVETILEHTPSMAVVARNPDGRIITATEFIGELGLSRRDVEGMSPERWYDVVRPLHPDGSPMPLRDLPVQRALRGEEVIGSEGSVRNGRGERIPVVCNAAPIHNRHGVVIGAVSVCTDLRRQKALEAELRQLVEEKTALYKELAHRVKNHLQIMSGLIRLEVRDKPPEVADFGRLIQGRLQGLSSIYDGMSRAGSGAHVEAAPFADHICGPYRTSDIAVEVKVEPQDLILTSDQACPIGMILNEAVCNSYKHAFPGRTGRIQVSLRRDPDGLSLEVADDGVGLREGATGRSQGMALMRLQANEACGALEIANRPEGGARVRLHVPERTVH